MRISDWSSDVCSSDVIFVQCVIVYRDHSHRRSLYPGSGRDVPSATALQSSTHRMLRRLVFSHGFSCGFFRPLESAAGRPLEIPVDTFYLQIGRAHVWTPVTNAQLVCRLLLEK